jgi:hypothetical protein
MTAATALAVNGIAGAAAAMLVMLGAYLAMQIAAWGLKKLLKFFVWNPNR